jgi:hypothetical protein
MVGAGRNWSSRAVDYSAGLLFACAAAYSAYQLAGPATAAVAWLAGLCASVLGLSRVAEEPAVELPAFVLEPLPRADADELLLTDLHEPLLSERHELLLTVRFGSEPELMLDDRLEPPDCDSRVIRLFDPRTMPSAGDPHEQIDRHVDRSPVAIRDATAELYHALAELKNALR